MFIRESQGKFLVVERVDDKNELILRTLDSYKEAEDWIDKASAKR